MCIQVQDSFSRSLTGRPSIREVVPPPSSGNAGTGRRLGDRADPPTGSRIIGIPHAGRGGPGRGDAVHRRLGRDGPASRDQGVMDVNEVRMAPRPLPSDRAGVEQ
jgi:hypothetical protein